MIAWLLGLFRKKQPVDVCPTVPIRPVTIPRSLYVILMRSKDGLGTVLWVLDQNRVRRNGDTRLRYGFTDDLVYNGLCIGRWGVQRELQRLGVRIASLAELLDIAGFEDSPISRHIVRDKINPYMEETESILTELQRFLDVLIPEE